MAERPVAANVGMVGIAGSGKTSLFCALTGTDYARAIASTGKGASGGIRVTDPRLVRLHEAEGERKKLVAPVLGIVDAPSVALEGHERAGNPGRLAVVRECDGYLAVLRAFEGEDPSRQLEGLRSELILADLDVMQKRMEKLRADTKKALPNREELLREFGVLESLSEAVASGDTEAFGRLSPEDRMHLRGFQFYSMKPLLPLANISEKDLERTFGMAAAAVRLESELLAMEDSERAGFMADYGLSRLVLENLPLTLYEALGLHTFVTTNEKELAAWALPRGATAHQAAGKIHTDFQKGFINCDVVSFEEREKWKTIREAFARGRKRTEGKAYVVQDFDILQIKFNV
jgi:ribosome-binding ATPase YchF (GTP1/OBG family)